MHTRGSHMKFAHAGTHAMVIVPYHKGSTLPIGTMKAIIEASGLGLDLWH